jgi:hypothetical protein
VHDALNVARRVAATTEDARNFLQVGDRVEAEWRLRDTKPAVEVGADGRVPRTARDPAKVVDVEDETRPVQSDCRR